MEDKPIVSVILPNHNYDDFIADAIMSVKTQTLSNIECIIIDDASTDSSVAVIKDLIKNDKRFKFVQNEKPLGISATRNIGLDMATGEYVAFLDSDDCYTPYALEMLVELARKTNALVAGGRTRFVDAYFRYNDSQRTWNLDGYTTTSDYTKLFLAGIEYKWIWIWRSIYKREALKNIRFPDEMRENGDDISFMLDLTYQVPVFATAKMHVVCHRTHPLSITAEGKKFNPERVKIFPDLFKRVRGLLDKYDSGFLRELYGHLFNYLLEECVVKTKGEVADKNASFLRGIIVESCRLIPLKYLKFKNKLLCWYLSCLK